MRAADSLTHADDPQKHETPPSPCVAGRARVAPHVSQRPSHEYAPETDDCDTSRF